MAATVVCALRAGTVPFATTASFSMESHCAAQAIALRVVMRHEGLEAQRRGLLRRGQRADASGPGGVYGPVRSTRWTKSLLDAGSLCAVAYSAEHVFQWEEKVRPSLVVVDLDCREAPRMLDSLLSSGESLIAASADAAKRSLAMDRGAVRVVPADVTPLELTQAVQQEVLV